MSEQTRWAQFIPNEATATRITLDISVRFDSDDPTDAARWLAEDGDE